jgi:hypothetical protein
VSGSDRQEPAGLRAVPEWPLSAKYHISRAPTAGTRASRPGDRQPEVAWPRHAGTRPSTPLIDPGRNPSAHPALIVCRVGTAAVFPPLRYREVKPDQLVTGLGPCLNRRPRRPSGRARREWSESMGV